VVLSTTPGSSSSNAWPAHPRPTLPRHNVGLKLPCALYCVPGRVLVCAHLTEHSSIGSGGAALTLETGAELRFSRTFDDLARASPRSVDNVPPDLLSIVDTSVPMIAGSIELPWSSTCDSPPGPSSGYRGWFEGDMCARSYRRDVCHRSQKWNKPSLVTTITQP
jgi:hypothetical protein